MPQAEVIEISRRHLFAMAGLSAGASLLTPHALFAEGIQSRSTGKILAYLPTVKPGTHTSFASIKQIDAGLLSVGYAEAGPADGPAVILLHGWPYDIYSFVDATPVLAAAGYHVIVPYLRGYGTTSFLSSATKRNAQQSAVGLDIIALMDALKIQKATVAGFGWGARTADVMAVLWPERCKAIVCVSGYLSHFGTSYYFATEVGKAGYAKYFDEFNKFIWHQASPKWNFDDATYNRTAVSFNNPDHVDIVMHDYRWRLGLADGERKYDDLEKRLAALPVVAVPAITMEGDSNGAIHAPSTAYRNKFSGKYDNRLITGGVGHNIPQEAPQAFAQAVIDVDRL